jgi:hypothetical protein
MTYTLTRDARAGVGGSVERYHHRPHLGLNDRTSTVTTERNAGMLRVPHPRIAGQHHARAGPGQIR